VHGRPCVITRGCRRSNEEGFLCSVGKADKNRTMARFEGVRAFLETFLDPVLGSNGGRSA
jgi:hypothetical protein